MNVVIWNEEIAEGSTVDCRYSEEMPDGTPVDLTGTTWEGQIRTTADAPEPVASYTFELTAHPITEEENRAVRIILDGEATAALGPKVYSHSIWKKHTGSPREPVMVGSLTILRDSTR